MARPAATQPVSAIRWAGIGSETCRNAAIGPMAFDAAGSRTTSSAFSETLKKIGCPHRHCQFLFTLSTSYDVATPPSPRQSVPVRLSLGQPHQVRHINILAQVLSYKLCQKLSGQITEGASMIRFHRFQGVRHDFILNCWRGKGVGGRRKHVSTWLRHVGVLHRSKCRFSPLSHPSWFLNAMHAPS